MGLAAVAGPPVPPALPKSDGPGRRVDISADFTALLRGGEILVEALPLEGESVTAFASRLSNDRPTIARVAAAAASVPGRPVRLSWGVLSGATRLAAVSALFPSDFRATAGWVHPAAGESWQDLAEWFSTGRDRGEELARANGVDPRALPARGSPVLIPVELLVLPFRDADPVSDEQPPSLEFGEDATGRYALYRIHKGEALYSAVVVRFTGRLHAADVIELALRLAERSGIEDVHAIPVGFPVKIPLDALSEEFLPAGDPKALAYFRERAETAQFGPPPVAAGLAGIRVVIDAGHGGRDTGTIHRGVEEATYVYDVASRLRKVLLERTHADVAMTTQEPSIGFTIANSDRLRDSRNRVLLTNPPYRLQDPVAGVNLRWYLANAVLRRPGGDRRLIPPERTVFLSLHADSLHPSVRGAMAYVPGERFLRDRYGKTGALYAAFREYRDEPAVSFSRRDRVAAEGMSTPLARRLLSSFRDAGLPVHRFSPVRTHVIRGGREWVPAVLRYNRIPYRVLLEIANLGNEDDRELTLTREFRQAVAEAIARGLVEFFGGASAGSSPAVASVPAKTEHEPFPKEAPYSSVEAPPEAPAVDPPRPGRATRRGVARAGAAPATTGELPGPWPEVLGPWPEGEGPWPSRVGPMAPPKPRRD